MCNVDISHVLLSHKSFLKTVSCFVSLIGDICGFLMNKMELSHGDSLEREV